MTDLKSADANAQGHQGAQGSQESLRRLQGLLERARDLELSQARAVSPAPVPAGPAVRTEGDLDPALRLPRVDLCAALLRMRLSAVLDKGWAHYREHDPLHLSVFGGTNTGKSTVINVLLGRPACGMQVTGRFSQHPEAWRSETQGEAFLDQFQGRFAGYARFDDKTPIRQSDEELASSGYRPALGLRDWSAGDSGDHWAEVAGMSADNGALKERAVFWDAPDFSTEQAQAWMGAVVDTVALAEVVLFVATHESYADDRGLSLLKLVARSTAAVEVVANKVESRELFEDLQEKLQAAGESLERFRFHRLPRADASDAQQRLRWLLDEPQAKELRQAVGERIAQTVELKRAGVEAALVFLDSELESALEPLRAEARVADRWQALVQRVSERELGQAYRNDYLQSRSYEEFRLALAELVRLMEIPGIGKLFTGLGKVARMPLALVRKAFVNLTSGSDKDGEGVSLDGKSEEQVISRLFRDWLVALRAEAQTLVRAEGHPAWSRLAERIDDAEFQGQLIDGFQKAYEVYRDKLKSRVTEAAEAIYAELKQNPKLLNGLRAANLVGDAGVTFSAVAAGGLSPTDFVLGPMVHGLWEEMIQRGMGAYIKRQEEQLKREQAQWVNELFRDTMEIPARALFVGAVDPGELDRWRDDWSLVRREIKTELKN